MSEQFSLFREPELVEIDEYVDAWCQDPVMNRYWSLVHDRGLEIVTPAEGYL